MQITRLSAEPGLHHNRSRLTIQPEELGHFQSALVLRESVQVATFDKYQAASFLCFGGGSS